MDLYQQKIYERIERFVPQAAVREAYSLWESFPFRFVISKSRNTKLGDFRKRANEDLAVITVNENLNPYNFLVTYVHEVAHHWVYEKHKSRVQPHGQEWKDQFQLLMQPFLNAEIFPEPLLSVLKRHMLNPKASSQSDLRLAKALQAFDAVHANKEQGVALHTLAVGSTFELEKRIFKSLEARRTRVRCQETSSGKNYLVHKLAMVKPIQAE